MNKQEVIESLEKKRERALENIEYFANHSDNQEVMNRVRVDVYTTAIQAILEIDEPQAEKVEAHLAEHWNEDIGDVLWWNFPVEEPPYCGTPLDEHFPKYKTHFTTIDMPTEIEQPKRWVVKNEEGRYFVAFSKYAKTPFEGVFSASVTNLVTFDDKAKAEAVAVLVEGSVEEV